MRVRSRILDALLSRTKQDLLAVLLLDPEREWYPQQLAAHLQVNPTTLYRDLAAFVEADILNSRRDGNRVYYQADPNCPILGELRMILIKTVGLVDLLEQALAPLADDIDVAFVYGSIASSEEHSMSDIDLMVIGKVSMSALAVALRGAQESLRREVSANVYPSEEFAAKIKKGGHFLRNVVASPKLFIYGDEGELAATTQGKAS